MPRPHTATLRRRHAIGIVTAFVLTLLGVLCAPSIARAVCREGRSSQAGAVEHCCWPGQVWSDESASCTGVAQCPRGFVPIENRCRAIDEEPYRSGPLPAGSRLVRRPSITVAGLGFSAFGVGYGIAFLSAATGTFANQCPQCAVYTPSLIPVIGPLISAGAYSAAGGMFRSTFWTYAVMDSLTQIVGILGIVVGYRGHRVIVYEHAAVASRPRGPRFAVIPTSPGALGGLTLAGWW